MIKLKKKKEDDAEFKLDQSMEDPSDDDERMIPAASTKPKRAIIKFKRPSKEVADLETDQSMKDDKIISASPAPKKHTKEKVAPKRKKEKGLELELDQTMEDPCDSNDKIIIPQPPKKHTRKKTKPKKKIEGDDQSMRDLSDDDKLIPTASKKRKVSKRKAVEVTLAPSSTTMNDKPTIENITDVTAIILDEKEKMNEEESPITNMTLVCNNVAETTENQTIEHFSTEETIVSEFIDIESPDEKEPTLHNDKSEYVADALVETILDIDSLDAAHPKDFVKEVSEQIHCESSAGNTINNDSFQFLPESGLVSTENELVHTIII